MNWIAKNEAGKREKMQMAREAQAEKGGVVTRFGNHYTQEEWDEMQAQWDAELAQAEDYDDKIEAIKREAGKKLEAAGIEGNTYGIAHRIFNNGTEGIQFSSEERRQLVEEIDRWMVAEARKAR